MTIHHAVTLGLLAMVLLTQSYVDLEVSIQLGPWLANAPISDVAALGLVPLSMWGLRKQSPTPLPGWRGYALMVVAGALSLLNAIEPAHGLHFLVRKPVMMYIGYAIGVSFAIRQLPLSWTIRLVMLWVGTTAAVSIGTSVVRITSGDALWFSMLGGLTPNHKTLAVSVVGITPLLLALRSSRKTWWLVVLIAAAVVASASKTAGLMLLMSAALFWPKTAPIGHRWTVLPMAALAVALAYYAPLIVESRAMLDAARSRHSLNRRAQMMFELHPLVGSGAGMSTVIEQATFPDYRVNGVDAHGVIQKVGGEMGLLGLAGYGWFSLATFQCFRRRWSTEDHQLSGIHYGALGTWGVTTAGLLLSTETFTQTWWAPLSVAWGLTHHPDASPTVNPAAEEPCAS